jgi:hypothetical protein
MRSRNDFRSAIDYQLAFIVVVAPATHTSPAHGFLFTSIRDDPPQDWGFPISDLFLISVIIVNQR